MSRKLTIQQMLRGALAKSDEWPAHVQTCTRELVMSATQALEVIREAAGRLTDLRDLVRGGKFDKNEVKSRVMVVLSLLCGTDWEDYRSEVKIEAPASMNGKAGGRRGDVVEVKTKVGGVYYGDYGCQVFVTWFTKVEE